VEARNAEGDGARALGETGTEFIVDLPIV